MNMPCSLKKPATICRLTTIAQLFVITILCFFTQVSLAESDSTVPPAVTGFSDSGKAVNKKASEPQPSAGANIDLIQQALESLTQDLASSKQEVSLSQSSLAAVQDGLRLLEQKLKESLSGFDSNQEVINSNSDTLKETTTKLLAAIEEIRTNTEELDAQKSLIEDNSIRLYEILIRLSNMREQMGKLSDSMLVLKNTDTNQEAKQAVDHELNTLWRLLCSVLVLLGSLAIVVAHHPSKSPLNNTAVMQQQTSLLIISGAFLAFFLVGFGLTFGQSSSGLIGSTTHLFGTFAPSEMKANASIASFMLYQMGFVILAALMVYNALGSQLSVAAHLIIAVLIGGVVIPLFAHWTWASQFLSGNKGWLEGAGFVDQAGAVTIHVVIAWFVFMLAWKLGKPSEFKIQKDYSVELYPPETTLLLMISGIGFTTGNLSIAGDAIPVTAMNLILAASMGGLSSYLLYAFYHSDKQNSSRQLTGGVVSGLIAIAACAQSVSAPEAMLIGFIAGILQSLGYGLLRKRLLKHPWQELPAQFVSAHGFAGIWGGLSFGLFATENTFGAPDTLQLVTQVQGIAAAIAYGLVMAHFAMLLLSRRKAR